MTTGIAAPEAPLIARRDALRQFLWLFVPGTLLLLALAFTGAYWHASDRIANQLMHERTEIALAGERIHQDFANASADLLILADLPDIHRYLDFGREEDRLQTTEVFRAFARNKQVYDQIRHIDASGMERIRVDFNDGEPVAVPDARLQDKSGRYYFRDAYTLPRGEVFVSPLDLNIERDRIEVPYKPMLRFAAPVFDRIGHKRGVILLNYFGNHLLDHFRATVGKDGCRGMLLNSDGDWLASPNRDDEWGFMFGNGRAFGRVWPEEWRIVSSREEGIIDNANGLFVFGTIYPLRASQRSSTGSALPAGASAGKLDRERYYWKIVAHVPPEALPSVWFFRQPLALALFLSVWLLLAAVTWPLAQALTARKRLQASLAENEARFRGLTDSLPGIAYRCALDADWTVQIMSGEVRRLTGYPATDFLDRVRSYASVIHPDDRALVERAVEKGVRARESYEIEYRLRRRDGAIVDVHEKGQGVFAPDGRLLWLDGFIWEVTERKQALDALRRTEEWLRLAQEAGNVGAWEYDMASQRESWSPQMAAIYGIEAGASLNHDDWLARIHPDDVARVVDEERQALEEQRPFQIEFRILGTNGAIRWIQGRGGPVRDDEGRIVRVLGVDIDITARKLAEIALHESEERFRLFMDNSPAIAWIKDAEGRIVYLNRTFERQFGVRLTDWRGKTDHELWPADMAQSFRQADLDVLAKDTPAERDEQTLDAEGQPIHWHTLKIPFRDTAGQRYVGGMAFDITERHRAKAALRLERDRNQRYLDTVQTIMVALDTEGRITMINRHGCELLGYPASELLLHNWFETCLPQPLGTETMLPAFRQVMAGELAEAEYCENPVRCRDGRQRLIAWHNACLTDQSGKIVGTLSSGEDITERKQSETALRDAEKFKQTILDAVSTQVAVLDRQGVIVAVNRPWRRFAQENGGPDGLPAARTDIGTNYLDICRAARDDSSEGASAALEGITAVLDGRAETYSQDYPCHAPDRPRWFAMTVAPLGGDQGGAVVSHVDITAPRTMAEELRAGEERFRLLFENAPIGIAMADNDCRLLRVNKALCDMLGYDEQALVGKSFVAITHPDDVDANLDLFERACKNQISGYRLRKRYLHRDGGTVWVNLFSTQVRAASGESLYSVGMIENITERVNAEQERLAHEAVQRDTLVREVHHRIKNNLHGVIALLNQDIDRHPEAAAPLQAAIGQIKTISVVYGLQSHLHKNELRPTELLAEIVKTAATLALVAPPPAIENGLSGDVCLNRNASVSIALILNELIQNALKHGRHEGDSEVAVSIRGNADRLCIRVDNPGAPLPAGLDLASGAGCGIGLDLVRTLLPRKGARLSLAWHDGRIRAELELTPPVIATRHDRETE